MRLVLREKKKLQEAKFGKYGDIFVKMKPLTFLKLTMPAPDFDYLIKFLEATKGKPPEEKLEIAKSMKAATAPGEVDIGKDVVFRGAFFFNKTGSFNKEMAGRLSLAMESKGENIEVTSHGGRARSLIAHLAGVPEIEASIMCYGFKWEELDENEQIKSQNFDGDPTNFIDKKEIKVEEDEEPIKNNKSEAVDYLNLENGSVVFKDKIYRDHKTKEVYATEKADKQASSFIGARYINFTKQYRKDNNLKADEMIPVIEVIKKFADYLNENYTAKDEAGDLKFVAYLGGFVSIKFDRPSEGDLTLSKK